MTTNILKSIAHQVFPTMTAIGGDGRAELGEWGAELTTSRDAAWLTVSHGRDVLFRVGVNRDRVEAVYALPAVMERGDGEKFYGTAWANSRRWMVTDDVSREIREFFDNIDEFLEEEAKVYKALGESE